MEFAPNFDLPEFCEFYKFLLVDEVALCRHPIQQHHGKCSLIGFIDHKGPLCYLTSLTIQTVPSCYQIQDGHFSIRLVTPFGQIPDSVAVEIFGEVRLIEENSKCLYSPSDLIAELRDLQLRLEHRLNLPLRDPTGLADKDVNPFVRCQLENALKNLNDHFVPAILVHSFNCIDQPNHLIACNLSLRNLL